MPSTKSSAARQNARLPVALASLDNIYSKYKNIKVPILGHLHRFPRGQCLGKTNEMKWGTTIGNKLGTLGGDPLGTWWEHIPPKINLFFVHVVGVWNLWFFLCDHLWSRFSFYCEVKPATFWVWRAWTPLFGFSLPKHKISSRLQKNLTSRTFKQYLEWKLDHQFSLVREMDSRKIK